MSVDCYDNAITPQPVCTKNAAMFTCGSTGHPDPVSYTWTHWYWSPGTAETTSTGPTYDVNAIGFHTVQCAAEYSAPSYCDDYSDFCRANHTVQIFREYARTCLNV